jgi:hypothetical protein
LEPRKAPGKAPKKLDEKARKLLVEDLQESVRGLPTPRGPSSFLLCGGVSVSEATVCRTLRRLFAQPKKRSKGAVERDEFLRSLWRMEVGRIDPSGLVFVDEMGTHTSLAPLYAYSPVGGAGVLRDPQENRGKNTTLLTSLHAGGMGPSMAVEGATTSRVFETYIERVLAPALRPGQRSW